MKTKKILFIDDEDVSENIITIRRNLKRAGFDLQTTVVNPRCEEFLYRNDETGKLETDFRKLQDSLIQNNFPIRYDVVACDFNFAKDPLNGYEVIRWMINTSNGEGATIRKALFVSYSSVEENFTENIIKNDELIKLIRLKIHSFYSRPRLSNELSKLLLKEAQNLNLSDQIRDELERYKEYTFKNTYPKFEKKTLGEIALEVEKDSHHGMEFQKYIIQLTIAHILELNSVQK
jgi:uncharacterized membrane protein YheB (UPF0754 family)